MIPYVGGLSEEVILLKMKCLFTVKNLLGSDMGAWLEEKCRLKISAPIVIV